MLMSNQVFETLLAFQGSIWRTKFPDYFVDMYRLQYMLVEFACKGESREVEKMEAETEADSRAVTALPRTVKVFTNTFVSEVIVN